MEDIPTAHPVSGVRHFGVADVNKVCGIMDASIFLMSAGAFVLVCTSADVTNRDGGERTTIISFDKKKSRLTNVAVDGGPNGETRNWKAKFRWDGISFSSRTSCGEGIMHLSLHPSENGNFEFGGSGSAGNRCGSHVVFVDSLEGLCRLTSGDLENLKANVKK